MQSAPIKLFIYRLHQDDPRKCTAAKLLRLSYCRPIFNKRNISKKAIVLDPFEEQVFSPDDKRYLHFGLIAIDCSWKKVNQTFRRGLRGVHRRLPLLLSGNPINYGHLSILSSVEALAAALYISGCKDQAKKILSIFKWGPSFLALNMYVLEDYSSAWDEKQILRIEDDYFKASPYPDIGRK